MASCSSLRMSKFGPSFTSEDSTLKYWKINPSIGLAESIDEYANLKFVIFSPIYNLWFNLFSTQSAWITTKKSSRQNIVNCDKKGLIKFFRSYISGDTLHLTHILHVEKFQISTPLLCGEIWNFFAYMEKLQISPHLSGLDIWNSSTNRGGAIVRIRSL